MVEKILNNTTPYGKIRASHEGSLHSSTLMQKQISPIKSERYSITEEAVKICFIELLKVNVF